MGKGRIKRREGGFGAVWAVCIAIGARGKLISAFGGEIPGGEDNVHSSAGVKRGTQGDLRTPMIHSFEITWDGMI